MLIQCNEIYGVYRHLAKKKKHKPKNTSRINGNAGDQCQQCHIVCSTFWAMVVVVIVLHTHISLHRILSSTELINSDEVRCEIDGFRHLHNRNVPRQLAL